MKKSGQHLDLDMRIRIEEHLTDGSKLVEIAKELKRDPRGISFEIKRNRIVKLSDKYNNICTNQINCKVTRLCNSCVSGRCTHCTYMKCNDLCRSFSNNPSCIKLNRFPYVCNGCENRKICRLPKYYYYYNEAHQRYLNNVSDCKTSRLKFNEKQMAKLNMIVSENVRKGHSLDIIRQDNNIQCSTVTLYSYIDKNLLDVKNIDLKRKVRYATRKDKQENIRINYAYLDGRRFEDFQAFFINNPTANIWQMDGILGKKGKDEDAILSLLYTKTNLQLYFKIKSESEEEINRVFDNIKARLGSQLFSSTFECILTDNGQGFKNPLQLETDSTTAQKLISLFYCEPRRSDQKAACEKNHEHFREICPKGRSMNDINSAKLYNISNNVNNYPRKSLQYKTPLELSRELLDEKVLKLNALKTQPRNKVFLKPLK